MSIDKIRATIKWSNYIPKEPHPRQLVFLLLDDYREALFGGAAGGGKSEAILMGALQYADVPGYSALILRKNFSDLSLPGALMFRAHEWLAKSNARWNQQNHSYTFPSGATLAFGYLDSEMTKFRYQSAEFQYIGFDEVTQFAEEDYTYLFSRLRATKKVNVPLRMRAAANPGGIGHIWVKKRFGIMMRDGIPVGTVQDRPFIPSFLKDNPSLDSDDYRLNLENLDAVTRGQLLHGDWDAAVSGRFNRAWFRRYHISHNRWLVLCPASASATTKASVRKYELSKCSIFCTVDPAASVREGPGDSEIWRREPSWSVISTWLLTPDFNLIWLDLWRAQVEIPELLEALAVTCRQHRPEFMGIEASGLGIGVYQTAQAKGLPVRALKPRSQDKLVRATDACNRAEMGKIYLPDDAPWLDDLESELFTWVGHPKQAADQIDTLAYAAMYVTSLASGTDENRYDGSQAVISSLAMPISYTPKQTQQIF